MIRLYWRSFLIALSLCCIPIILFAYWVSGIIYQHKIDAANLVKTRTEAHQSLGGVSDRLLKQETLAKIKLLRTLYQFIDDKKAGRNIATDATTNFISPQDIALFESECRVQCKALRDALLGRIGRPDSTPDVVKNYDALFGLGMLKAIADDLERLATLLQV